MASTRRVTVRASRTRPGPQTKRSTPPSRASLMELLGRLADGEPAANFEYRDSSGFADVDFHGQPVSHGRAPIYPHWVAMTIRLAAPHYTLEDKLHKVSYTKGTVPEVCGRNQTGPAEWAHQKNKSLE